MNKFLKGFRVNNQLKSIKTAPSRDYFPEGMRKKIDLMNSGKTVEK